MAALLAKDETNMSHAQDRRFSGYAKDLPRPYLLQERSKRLDEEVANTFGLALEEDLTKCDDIVKVKPELLLHWLIEAGHIHIDDTTPVELKFTFDGRSVDSSPLFTS